MKFSINLNYIMLFLVWLESKTNVCFGFGFWIFYTSMFLLYMWCWKAGYITYKYKGKQII